jgi:hypothetical protein
MKKQTTTAEATRVAYIEYVRATVDVILKPETAIVKELLQEQGLSEQEVLFCLHESICERYMQMLEKDNIEGLFDKYFERIRTVVAEELRNSSKDFHIICPEWDRNDPMARKRHNKRQLLGLAFDLQLSLIEA